MSESQVAAIAQQISRWQPASSGVTDGRAVNSQVRSSTLVIHSTLRRILLTLVRERVCSSTRLTMTAQ